METSVYALNESFSGHPSEIPLEGTTVRLIGQAHFTMGPENKKLRFGPFRYGLETCRTFRRLLAEFQRSKPALVHLFTADPGAFVIACWLRLFGYRVVLDIDDSVYGMAILARYPQVLCWGLWLLETILPRCLPYVTVANLPLAERYPRSRYIPYAVDSSQFIRHSDPLSGNIVHVILVGTMGAQHAHLELLETIPSILGQDPRIRFSIIGTGERFPAVKARIRSLGLEETVECTGPLSHAETLRRMCAADIGLCPLSDNPFDQNRLPIKILEYMASGLALITAPVGGVNGLIRHLENGWLYRPGDMNALAQGVIFLASNPECARRLAAQARKEVCAFDTDSIAPQWTAFYEQIAK